MQPPHPHQHHPPPPHVPHPIPPQSQPQPPSPATIVSDPRPISEIYCDGQKRKLHQEKSEAIQPYWYGRGEGREEGQSDGEVRKD